MLIKKLNSFSALNLLNSFRYLSVDVALGAVVMSLFISFHLKFSYDWMVGLAIFLSTWFIYTLDHLFDIRKIQMNDKIITHLSERHFFHLKHKKNICYLLIINGLFLCLLLFYLPFSILCYGIIISVMMIFYFLLIHYFFNKNYIGKELMIAMIYALSIIGPSLVGQNFISFFMIKNQLIFGIIIFFLALTNIFLISHFEQKIDEKSENYSSFGTYLNKKSRIFIVASMLIIYYLLIGYFYQLLLPVLWIWIIMGIVLLLILLFPNYFHKKERYRNYADAIFLIPLIPIFFNFIF